VIEELIKAAQTEVYNHSIYVWGGSGQLCCQVDEAWIRQKEKGRQPDAAVMEWEKVMASPYKDVARCFDCSGYVSWCLKKAGAFSGRTDCDGLFARSEEIYSPIDGCLLFRVNPKNPKDETHVGIYFQGKQYEARGRKDGVVCIDYNPNYWQKLAWFKALKPDPEPTPPDPPTPPEPPTEQKVIVKGKSVWVRDSDSTQGKKLFVAHKGQKYELIDIAPSGWYHIMTTYPDAYITNKTRYTVLENE
jgi:hypothetical protein